MFKIVHCADLHIGARCGGLSPEKALIRREEIKKSLTYIVDFCLERHADALLICGDLFDVPVPPAPDVYFVKSELERLGTVPVFIAAGNHDYLNRNSPYDGNMLGKNVAVFPGELSAFTLPDSNLRIYGRSFTSPVIEPIAAFPKADKSCVNILCLHGDIDKSSDYSPADLSTVASFGADYCALGHVHSLMSFKAGSVPCINPGIPEGHGFDDDGDTAFIYAEVSKSECRIERVCKTVRKYITITVDATPLQTNKNIISELEGSVSEDNIYQIIITGALDEASDFSRAYIESYLSSCAFSVKVIDKTSQDAPLEVILKENSPRGLFLRELRALCRSEEEFAEAARIGLNALSGRETDI